MIESLMSARKGPVMLRFRALLKKGETEAPDGKIGLGILYEDNSREELCDVQAEKKEEAAGK